MCVSLSHSLTHEMFNNLTLRQQRGPSTLNYIYALLDTYVAASFFPLPFSLTGERKKDTHSSLLFREEKRFCQKFYIHFSSPFLSLMDSHFISTWTPWHLNQKQSIHRSVNNNGKHVVCTSFLSLPSLLTKNKHRSNRIPSCLFPVDKKYQTRQYWGKKKTSESDSGVKSIEEKSLSLPLLMLKVVCLSWHHR